MWSQSFVLSILLLPHNVSVNSKLAIPPGKALGKFLKSEFPTGLGHKESAKPRPLGQKNRAKTLLPGQLFSKVQQRNTKHEIEIMKNSTETLTCVEILKQ